MKFRLPVNADQFSSLAQECLIEYNAARNLPHLYLHLLSCDQKHLVLQEGRPRPQRGAPVFRANITPVDGGVEIEGTLTREPAATPRERWLFVLRQIGRFLLFTLVPFFLAVALMALFESGAPFVAEAVPVFMGGAFIFCKIRDELWSRRRLARFFVAYMGGESLTEKPRRITRKKRGTYRFAHLFHLIIWYLLLWPVRLFLRLRFNYRTPRRPRMPKGNFIMMSNHVTDYDMLYMAVAMRRQMYFVISEHIMRKGFLSRLLACTFDPIPRSKGAQATVTVMTLLHRARAGYNTAIFPEGFRTMSGYNSEFSPGTGAMVRKMKCNLVTFRIKGGYYTTPVWGKGVRRGRMWGEFAGVYTAEQLAAMTDEQVNALIARDIYEDAAATQAQLRIPYRASKKIAPAEHLELALFICPLCQRMGQLTSSGDTFSCACGAVGRYNEYGDLISDSFPYRTAAEWSRWQEAYVASLPDMPPEDVLFEVPHQNLLEADSVNHVDVVREQDVPLVVTPEALLIGAHRFPFKEIAYFDVVRHGYPLFTTHDGRYFEVLNPQVKFPGVLVKLLYRRFGTAAGRKNKTQ